MVGAINRENGGTHDTNLQVYEHTSKKFKRIKYSRFCVCEFCPRTNLLCVFVCVYTNIYVKMRVCMCACVRA